MTLGQRILHHRTRCGMSQLELAERLGVSRQSISKWETDGSVPELDKLVKLSEAFSVTLDELVRGRAEENAVSVGDPVVIVQRTPVRMVVGGVLLACGILLFFLLLLYTEDFWASVWLTGWLIGCGVICLRVEEHPGLWCLLLCVFLSVLVFPLIEWTMRL